MRNAVICGLAAICATGPTLADPTNVLPPGYKMESFESDWVGPGADLVCESLMRAAHPNQRYQIIRVEEDRRFRDPMLRIDSQYRYRCTVLLAPTNVAVSQDPTDVLPPGYQVKSFESEWLEPGNNRDAVCTKQVQASYPNRRYQIMWTDETIRFIPDFRIETRFKYRCTVLLSPT